ncbi:hypothetical protein AAG906_022011 [Vitis piasezkii]
MTRTRRGYIARRRRTKIRLFTSSFRGPFKTYSNYYSTENQSFDFRRLWITRINAVIHENGASYSYSRFIHDLYKRQLLLNRKILAQIAISNRNCLYMISNEIIK